MKLRTEKLVDVQEWDDLIESTYGKPYSFQQQDGCKSRGIVPLTVPCKADDFENATVPEEVNHEEMGVSFSAWLARDRKQPVGSRLEEWAIDVWWKRNFYPSLQMVANDLHKSGLLEAGDYLINIDW